MQNGSITETSAVEFSRRPLESFDGLILQYIEHAPSTERPQSDSCKNLVISQVCWEENLALILVVLTGLLILVLFYYVLLLRHKLHLAQAGNALEYFGFYHMANYSLKNPQAPSLHSVNSDSPEEVPPCSRLPTVVPTNSVIPPLILSPPPPPPPPLSSRSLATVHLPHPIIYTTPPSPQSDADIYSRIGTLQPFRHSSASQTQVVLFEHSSL